MKLSVLCKYLGTIVAVFLMFLVEFLRYKVDRKFTANMYTNVNISNESF